MCTFDHLASIALGCKLFLECLNMLINSYNCREKKNSFELNISRHVLASSMFCKYIQFKFKVSSFIVKG